MADNRIDAAFEQLSGQGRKGLFPFLVGGYPDIETTAAMIRRCAAAGCAGVELGFPFSDPIADGPVIQAAYYHALDRGVRPADIMDMVRDVRGDVGQMPIVGMVSYSIVFRLGVEQFGQDAANAGFDGLIIPDLSLEEAPDARAKLEKAGLRLVMLVSPTSTDERRSQIAELASGFVYYMSVAGVTGERTQLPPELAGRVSELKQAGGKPVVVGFGVHTAEQVRAICEVADGTIVGSAIVRRITQALDDGADSRTIVDQVGTYVDELLGGVG